MRKRILAVDDEIRILTILKRRLEFAGYDVTTAMDGREALSKVRSERPDLIILDLILPGLNGYQLCSILKGDRLLKNIPVLMLSARSQERDIEAGMKAGADAYMTKPYNADVLIDQIGLLLQRADADLDERRAEARAHEERQLAEATLKAEKFSRLLTSARPR